MWERESLVEDSHLLVRLFHKSRHLKLDQFQLWQLSTIGNKIEVKGFGASNLVLYILGTACPAHFRSKQTEYRFQRNSLYSLRSRKDTMAKANFGLLRVLK